MLKPDLLRAALVASLPEYGRDPDRLVMFAERGQIASRFAPPNYNFVYEYDLKVMLLDFADHIDLLMLPVLRWLTLHQPGLLQAKATANSVIAFDAEMLAGGTADIEFTLALTETVRVLPRDDGSVDLEHLPEPAPVDYSMTGVDPAPRLRELFNGPVRVLPAQ